MEDLIARIIVQGGIGFLAIYVLFKAIQWQREDRKESTALTTQVLNLQTNFNIALHELKRSIDANTVMDGDKLKAIRANSEDIRTLNAGFNASMDGLREHVSKTSDAATSRLVNEITQVLGGLEDIKRQAGEHTQAAVKQQSELISQVNAARDSILEKLNSFIQSQPALAPDDQKETLPQ